MGEIKKSFKILLSISLMIISLNGFGQDVSLVNYESNGFSIPSSALLLSEYIQYPSKSGNEFDAGTFLSKECARRGLFVEIFTNDKDRFNFAASLYPLEYGKPNIVLLNHIDVVNEGNNANWKYPPYSGTISDGMVWGRGAIDNKGMAIMQLEAISKFIELSKNEDLSYNVTLLSVSSEETGGDKGARIIVDSFLKELNPMIVLGEGGAGVSNIISMDPDQVIYGISIAQKRALWLKLKLEMHTSGHGSVPPEQYVNKKMICAVNRLSKKKSKIIFTESNLNMFYSLGELEGGIKGFVLKNINLFKPIVSNSIRKEALISSLVTNTITITNINNPEGASNIISQYAEVTLDCRLLPETKTEDFINFIQKLLHDDDIEIEIIKETQKANASSTNEMFEILETSIQEIHPEAKTLPILFPAYNDNNYFRAKGIPVYGLLPIELGRELMESIHGIDERISIESLQNGILIYEAFIKKMIMSAIPENAISQN